MQQSPCVNYYVLFDLPVSTSSQDIVRKIESARKELRQGGWRAWRLRLRGFDIEAAALAEAIFSDAMSRRAYDQQLRVNSDVLHHAPPFW